MPKVVGIQTRRSKQSSLEVAFGSVAERSEAALTHERSQEDLGLNSIYLNKKEFRGFSQRCLSTTGQHCGTAW